MSTSQSLSFAALLKRHRRLAHLTQEQLAGQAGYSVSYISMLERGERIPVRSTVELLADALGVSPADRMAFAMAARGPAPALSPPPAMLSQTAAGPPPPPLVGRARELARLGQHLAGQGPPLLLLTGEPGIGKSRLLIEARQQAEARGWITLGGGSQRQGGQMPYAPLLGALEWHVAQQPPAQLRLALEGCAWLARLLPELAEASALPTPAWPLPPEQERRLVFAAVARYLANVSGPAGTLLALDDLQWAGADALDLLAALIRSAPPARLRVIGAYRDAEVSPTSPLAVLLADLASARLAAQQPLGPLGLDEAHELAGGLLDELETIPATVERIIQRAGGVPFYLVSFAQSLRAGTPGGAPDDVPWDVTQTIRQRVAALPETAHELLDVAALAGQIVSRTLIVAVASGASGVAGASHNEETLAAALDAACRARLLVEGTADAYHFSHELIREVVAHEIGAARRGTLHRRIAEALERFPGELPVETLAYHYTQAGALEQALPYLMQAGDRARAMQALAAAEGYYHELVGMLERLGRMREAAEAREKLGAVLSTATRYDMAVETLERAAATYRQVGDTADEGRVVAQIGLVYASSGEAASGIARIEPLLASATAATAMLLPAPVLAALSDALAQLYNIGGRYSEQLAATTQAVEFARAAGDERLLAQVQMRHGNALRMLGRMREATTVLEEAIRLAEAAGDAENLPYTLENVSVVYLLQGELETTDRYVRRALALVERTGDPIVVALMTLRRGMGDCALGRWEAARADFERADAMLQGTGTSWVSAYVATGLGLLQLAQGETDAGVRHLEEAVVLGERSGDLQVLRWAQIALAEHDLLAGQAQAAHDRLAPLLDRPGPREGLVTYLLPYLAWAEAERGDETAAHDRVTEGIVRAREERLHLVLVDALRVRALLALRRSDWMEAEEALEEALALCRAMPYPYAEAKALYIYGLLQQAREKPEQAQEQWGEALAILRRLGERLYAGLVETCLTGEATSG